MQVSAPQQSLLYKYYMAHKLRTCHENIIQLQQKKLKVTSIEI